MLAPAPNTPVYKTPVTSVRKGIDSSIPATSGPKPHTHARKRSRGTYQRSRMSKQTRNSNSSSDENQFTLRSLRLSCLNISEVDENNYVNSVNPPAITNSSRARDIISPTGVKALSAPTLPELDELRYRPKRRILKARNQGLFNVGEGEDDVFDFN